MDAKKQNPIQSHLQYQAALIVAEALLGYDPPMDTPKGILLDTLLALIQDYENNYREPISG